MEDAEVEAMAVETTGRGEAHLHIIAEEEAAVIALIAMIVHAPALIHLVSLINDIE